MSTVTRETDPLALRVIGGEERQSERIEPAFDAFVSYTRGDRSVAESLVVALSESGLDVWWDEQLKPTMAFDRQIQAVLESTTAIVAILSPLALQSDWVQWEVFQAIDNGLVVVPLLVGGATPDDLSEPLRKYQSIVLSKEKVTASLRGKVVGFVHRLVTESSVATNNQSLSERAASQEARRKLASAAADIARRAEIIKQTNSRIDLRERGQTRSESEAYLREASRPCTFSDGLVDLLASLRITVAFTSPQAGRLFFLGRHPDGEAVLSRQTFRKPMGISRDRGSLWMATFSHIYRLENNLDSGEWSDDVFEHCYIPRTRHYTGFLDTHDIGVTDGGQVVFVSTEYNCVAVISQTRSFRSIWSPPWIPSIEAGDRCHLNGLAIRNGQPRYVTATAMTSDIEEWRLRVRDGGVVIDIARNAIICDGLSLPHSPRYHDDKLFLLNTGTGEFGTVEESGFERRKFVPIAPCPGFARGLALYRGFAFVGVSRPRYGDFHNLTLEHSLTGEDGEAWTGIIVIDTRTGDQVGWLRFHDFTREIYDVAVLPGTISATSLGFMSYDTPGCVTFEE